MNNIINLQISTEHPDLAILQEKTLTTGNRLGSGCSCAGPGAESFEHNYIRKPQIKYWSTEDIATLESQIAEVNKLTSEYSFELLRTSDYEIEFDHDRSWPATFSFKSIKK